MEQNKSIMTEVEHLRPLFQSAYTEIGKVIVGQQYLVERLMMGLITGGHILVEGVPGLAKTKTVKAMAQAVDASFQRIQFTPDLLPADLIGTVIYQPRTQEFTVKKGPLFHHIILADEINRAPAKVQSALLEAMQEKQVTIGEDTFKLPELFIVLATQNPIEQEGTYSLPEAQIDRFMFKLKIGYPSRQEELTIMERETSVNTSQINAVLTPDMILKLRDTVKQIHVDPKINDYIIRLVFATREIGDIDPELVRFVQFGASPRASIALNLACKASAFLKGRSYVIPEDVKLMAPDVLRHRILLTFEAEAEGLTSDNILKSILDRVEVP